MSKRIRVGQTTYVVPDDATDDEITQIVDGQATAAPQIQAKEPERPGLLSTLGGDLWNMAKGLPQAAISAMPGIGMAQEALPESVQKAVGYTPIAEDIKGTVEREKERKSEGYSLPYRIAAPVAERLGVNVSGMEQSAQQGDTGGVVGHALAVPIATAATAGIAKGLPKVAPAIGRTLSAVPEVVDPDITGIFSPRIAHLQRVAGRIGKAIPSAPPPPVRVPQLEAPMSPAAEQLKSRIGIERDLRSQEPFPRVSEGLPEVEEGQAAATQHLKNAVQPRESGNFRIEQTPRRFAGEVEPEIPGRVSTYDFVGERSSPIPAREGLMLSGEVEPPRIAAPPKQLPAAFNPLPRTPKMPTVPGTADMPFKAPEPPTSPAIATKPITRQYFGGLLDQAYGAKSLSKDVPLRQQLDRVTPTAPKESSVVKSHSYDPETREMTVTTQNGQTYVHGDVTPEQAQAFSQSDSKGKAWNNLRGSSTLVAKVVNGKRVPIKPAGPRIATPQDLTPVLQESVKIARSQKK